MNTTQNYHQAKNANKNYNDARKQQLPESLQHHNAAILADLNLINSNSKKKYKE